MLELLKNSTSCHSIKKMLTIHMYRNLKLNPSKITNAYANSISKKSLLYKKNKKLKDDSYFDLESNSTCENTSSKSL